MVFVTIDAFFPFHLSDKNCNQIPGFQGIDKGLSVVCTMFMYLIAPAVIYTLSIVLVPGIPSFTEANPLMHKLVKTVKDTLSKHNDHHTFELNESFLSTFIPQIVQTGIKYLVIVINFLSPDILAFFAVNKFLLYVKSSLDKLTGDDPSNSKVDETSIEHVCYDSLSQSAKGSTGSTKGSYSKEYNAKVPSFYTISLWIHRELSQSYNSSNNVYFDKVLLLLSFTIFGHTCTEIGRCGIKIIAIKLIVMIAVSVGIWNNSLYSAFMKVDPILDEMAMDREKDVNETIAALVGIRSTLLQLVPELTILSMYIQTTSGSPLFVTGALQHRMPPLYMTVHDARVWAIRSQLHSLNVQSRSKTLLKTVLSAEIIIYNLKTSLGENNFRGVYGFENRRLIELALQRFLQTELNAYQKYNEWKRDYNNDKDVKLKVEIYHDLNDKTYNRSEQEEKYYIKNYRHFFVSKEIIIRFACREVSEEKGFSRLPYDIKEYLEDKLQTDQSSKGIGLAIQGNIYILISIPLLLTTLLKPTLILMLIISNCKFPSCTSSETCQRSKEIPTIPSEHLRYPHH